VQPEWIGTISALAGAAVAGGLAIVIGPKEAISAATEASLRLHEWAFGNGSRTAAVDAVDEFQAVSRRILKFDSVESKR